MFFNDFNIENLENIFLSIFENKILYNTKYTIKKRFVSIPETKEIEIVETNKTRLKTNRQNYV